MKGKWRISELRQAVELALSRTSYHGQASGRIREVPDTRTIRYYTTLGLVDRAAEMQGRTAYYDRRHVMQLVAIKRLQAAGKSLVQIQTELIGATPNKLRKLAGLPCEFWDELQRDVAQLPPGKAAADVDSSADVRAAFWSTQPELQTTSTDDEPTTAEIRHEVRFEFPNGIVISIPAELVGNPDPKDRLKTELKFAPLLSQLAEQLPAILSREDNSDHRVDLEGK